MLDFNPTAVYFWFNRCSIVIIVILVNFRKPFPIIRMEFIVECPRSYQDNTRAFNPVKINVNFCEKRMCEVGEKGDNWMLPYFTKEISFVAFPID